MPFNLTENELQLAYEAIEHHGYSVLVPAPPEWQAAKDHWDDYRQILAGLDLDTYRPKRLYQNHIGARLSRSAVLNGFVATTVTRGLRRTGVRAPQSSFRGGRRTGTSALHSR
jgi:hypothetical protein